MTTSMAMSLATSTAARMAAIDALALLAAIAVAVSVAGALVAPLLFERSLPRPYRLFGASPSNVSRWTAHDDVRDAA